MCFTCGRCRLQRRPFIENQEGFMTVGYVLNLSYTTSTGSNLSANKYIDRSLHILDVTVLLAL